MACVLCPFIFIILRFIAVYCKSELHSCINSNHKYDVFHDCGAALTAKLQLYGTTIVIKLITARCKVRLATTVAITFLIYQSLPQEADCQQELHCIAQIPHTRHVFNIIPYFLKIFYLKHLLNFCFTYSS